MRCINVEKVYGEEKVIKGISLDFDKNGLVFILGKSGSGKSTLLNILSTIDFATAGKVVDGDMNLGNMTQNKVDSYRKSNIGFVFQDYCLIPDLSVEENIALGDAYAHIDREKIKKLLERLGLDLSIVKKNARELSGGQQQRVSIARALYKDARIIYADEPTGNLDKENAHNIFEILKKISQKCLVIVVTHDREFAEEFADRIIEISDGKVIHDREINDTEGIIINPHTDVPREKIDKCLFKSISAKIGKHGILRKVISVLGMSLVLCIIGIIIAINQYDFSKLAAPVLENESKMPSFGICKGYTNSISGDFCFGPRPLGECEVEIIEDNYKENAKDYYYTVLGAAFASGGTGSKFLLNHVQFAVVSNEANMSMYGFTVTYGHYPKKSKEIAITDYMAYSIFLLDSERILNITGAKSKDQLYDKQFIKEYIESMPDIQRNKYLDKLTVDEMTNRIINNPGLLLLNQDIDLLIDSFTVSAIITTNYEKYEDMIYMSSDKLVNEERYQEFLYLSNLYCYNLYVTEEFVDKLYSNGLIFFDNAISCKYSEVKDFLNLAKELGRNEVLMSSSEFRSRYSEEFNPAKIDEYILEIESSTSYGKGGPNDIFYDGEDVNVVGVFDLPMNYESVFGIDSVIVFSDDYYDDYAKHQVHLDMIQMSMLENNIDYKNLITLLSENEMYFYNYVASGLYSLTPIMTLFQKIFVVILLIIIILACYMVINYFSHIISMRKRDIGIMRSLGISINDIKLIFVSIAVKIMGIVLVIAYILYTVGVELFNAIMSKNYLSYILDTNLKQLHIINNSFIIYIVLLITIGVLLFVATLIPLKKISRINAIDIIRK